MSRHRADGPALGAPPGRVVEIDVHDDAQLRAWHDVEAASVTHGRPYASHRTYAALAAAVRNPTPYGRRVLLAALDGETVLGVAEVAWPLQDNPHLIEVEVNVAPPLRRRGVGRLLHDAADAVRVREGRTTAICEVVLDRDDAERAGLAFARALGYDVVHTEEHLVLDLPAEPASLDALRADVPGYSIITWGDRCPEEHLAGYAAMRTRMEQDVPVGDVAVEAVRIDEERLRVSEERLARSYATVVAAALADDGSYAGYSLVFVPHGTDDVLQDDTLVMPEHRGHALGLQLKLATMDVLRREHAERRVLHTWTDPDNTAMHGTNTRFGFRPAEVMHEVQRVVS